MWSRVFIMTACIYFAGNLVYVLLCRATVQPWNEPQASQADEKGTRHRPAPCSAPTRKGLLLEARHTAASVEEP